MRNHWTEIEKYLEDQKIAQELIGELRDFHMRYEVKDQIKERVEKPDILFYGKKILEMSIAALLQGDNLLLSGAKATGKVRCLPHHWQVHSQHHLYFRCWHKGGAYDRSW